MSQITEHLSESEYACRGAEVEKCGLFPPDYDTSDMPACYDYLFDCFERVRERWGKPLNVTSGYRCFKHNQMVNGTPLSAHLFGLALDILCKDKAEVKKLRDVIREECPDIRIGWKSYGENLVHLDCAFYVSPRPTSNFVESAEW